MHQSKVSIFDSKAHIGIMKHEVLPRQICRFISSLVLANSTDQHCRTSALALMIHSWLNTLATGLLKSWAVLGNRRQKALEIRLGRGREGQPPRGVHNKRWGHFHALVPVPWSPHLFFFWQKAQSKSITTSSNQTSRKRGGVWFLSCLFKMATVKYGGCSLPPVCTSLGFVTIAAE